MRLSTAIVFLSLSHIKTMHKATAFIDQSQNELSALCRKTSFMLDDVSKLIVVLEEKSHLLALKASGGIAQLTNVSTAIKTLVDDYEMLVEKAKIKFEALSQAFQETTQVLLHTDVEDVVKESEVKQLMKKLDKLQKEIQVLAKN
ncbi:MAG: hypothetical protein J0647_06550 [Campylobacteraceae bacterium]|nr:hypothetical protein [Campylobacteraceae bacterium]